MSSSIFDSLLPGYGYPITSIIIIMLVAFVVSLLVYTFVSMLIANIMQAINPSFVAALLANICYFVINFGLIFAYQLLPLYLLGDNLFSIFSIFSIVISLLILGFLYSYFFKTRYLRGLIIAVITWVVYFVFTILVSNIFTIS